MERTATRMRTRTAARTPRAMRGPMCRRAATTGVDAGAAWVGRQQLLAIGCWLLVRRGSYFVGSGYEAEGQVDHAHAHVEVQNEVEVHVQVQDQDRLPVSPVC